jgi:hypothetical protein
VYGFVEEGSKDLIEPPADNHTGQKVSFRQSSVRGYVEQNLGGQFHGCGVSHSKWAPEGRTRRFPDAGAGHNFSLRSPQFKEEFS